MTGNVPTATLNNGVEMPMLGFGVFQVPDPAECERSVRDAIDVGYRLLDTAASYGNEEAVGAAIRSHGIDRRDLFVTTKLWVQDASYEGAKAAFERSMNKLQLDYLDLYLIHTPFAFQPGDNQDPRDKDGNVIYDPTTTLQDTWKALETLVDHGKCRAIGLSDITLDKLKPIYESARIKPAVVQVESHPYLPETELLDFCNKNGIVLLAFAPLGHGMTPGLLEDPVINGVAKRINKTPAQVLLAWAIQRGTALLTTPKSAARAKENFDLSRLPQDAFDEINRIQTRQRLNPVVTTGVPGFIPQAKSTAQGT